MKKSNLFLSASFLASFFLAPNPSIANESDEGTTVVVVQRQAYRGDVPIKLSPQSVDVLEADTLEELGITRLSDALDLSASMARQNNFGGLWDNFASRGFAGDENLPSGYLVNGFNAGRGFGGPRDVIGIDRIEILKGPNAALFGRGEPGGTVNIITKTPSFETEGAFGLSIGTYNRLRLEGDYSGPLSDQIAFRLSGFSEEAKSFRDTLESERLGLMPSLMWRISPKTRISYEAEISRQKIPFDRGVVSINNQLGLIPNSRFLGEPNDGPITANADGHQLQLQHDFSQAWSLLLGASYRQTDLEGFSSEAEVAGSRQRLFSDGQTLSRQRRFRDYEAQHTVYRAELSGRFNTGGIEHRLIAGLDADRFSNSQILFAFPPPFGIR